MFIQKAENLKIRNELKENTQDKILKHVSHSIRELKDPSIAGKYWLKIETFLVFLIDQAN